METMTETLKDSLVTRLRDREVGTTEFRRTARRLGTLLAAEAAEHLRYEAETVVTPLNVPAEGASRVGKLILVPILRSGLALLDSFLDYFDDATVGMVGLKRDEATAIADIYYRNVPSIGVADSVILLDPMIATGGSAAEAIKILIEAGATQEQIVFVCVITAPEGLARIRDVYPNVRIIGGTHDPGLNPNKFIDPGLGDFGDRYFGTV